MSALNELYQEVILDHNKRPRNFRVIEPASHHAEGHNPLCGDRLALYVQVTGDTIADVAFQGSGCAISKASASLMTDAVKGQTARDCDRPVSAIPRHGDDTTRPGGGKHGQALGARGRSGVPGPRQVRQPLLAHAEGSAGPRREDFNRVNVRAVRERPRDNALTTQ